MRFRSSISALWIILQVLVFVLETHEVHNPSSPPSATAFLHVNIVPMDREHVLEDQTVVVEADRITLIGPSNTIKVPRNARRIEAKGKYLIPGLVDAHVHLLSQIEFSLYLANGVTTVFNLDGRPGHLLWRKQVASGEVLGPTIFSTGPIFQEKRAAEEDVRLVDEQAAAGYDAIKIYNEVSKEEYPALINEAKRKNMLLMGHVAREPGFAMTLQYGQSIAHLEEIVYTTLNPKNDDDFDHVVFDESKFPGIVREIKNANIYVTPTLNNFAAIVQQATDLDAFLKNPELHYLAPWTLLRFQPSNDRYKNHFGPEKYAVLRNLLAIQRTLVKALSDEGVPLMAGTDATEVGPTAGFGLHHELQEFVQDGLSPYQALETATVNPARFLRNSAEFGTIEVGKRADMVLLEENPLDDISNTQKIAGVVVRGRYLDKHQLSGMLHAVPAEYVREQRKVEAMLHRDAAQANRYLEDHDPLGRLTAVALSDVASEESISELLQMLNTVRRNNPLSGLATQSSINALGYALMNKKLYLQAIAILEMNTENFPKSASAWDSLAEAFSRLGDVPNAIQSYRKALEADATYSNADSAKKFIAEHGQK
jgi:imidazolonepropionase-like amidohydrolase